MYCSWRLLTDCHGEWIHLFTSSREAEQAFHTAPHQCVYHTAEAGIPNGVGGQFNFHGSSSFAPFFLVYWETNLSEDVMPELKLTEFLNILVKEQNISLNNCWEEQIFLREGLV